MLLRKLIEVFSLELDYTLDGSYYLKNKLILVCLVSPHSGTNYKYMLRADSIKEHDRWGNCDFEEFFDTKDNIDRVLLELNEYYERLLNKEG